MANCARQTDVLRRVVVDIYGVKDNDLRFRANQYMITIQLPPAPAG